MLHTMTTRPKKADHREKSSCRKLKIVVKTTHALILHNLSLCCKTRLLGTVPHASDFHNFARLAKG